MKFLAILVLLIIAIAGCLELSNPTNITKNDTKNYSNVSIPLKYIVKDYCESDSDCVRQTSCCDCGLGQYVNKYNLENNSCNGPRCMCPTMLSKGVCLSNKCTAVPIKEEIIFCGRSTNGSCINNADCVKGGCSGQICQSKSEDAITTCEYRECYDSKVAGVSCGCLNDKCQWN
ncbi:MAG: eight-cysteine-cluster domain-containing protein [Candidatus Micrarchaeota archaeon]